MSLSLLRVLERFTYYTPMYYLLFTIILIKYLIPWEKLTANRQTSTHILAMQCTNDSVCHLLGGFFFHFECNAKSMQCVC